MKWALLCIVGGLVILTMTLASAVTTPVVEEQTKLDRDQTLVEEELAALKIEHKKLQHWVVKVLRPWVIQQAYKQSAALPEGIPTPSLAPLPPVPSPSVDPTDPPVNLPPVTPPGPTEPPSPSPSLCLPILCSAVP